VTTPKIRSNAVTGSKVRSNAVTGSKVNEATLEKVPLAATADTLGRLDYNSATGANPPGANTTGTVRCDPGLRVVGGGVQAGDVVNQWTVDSYPRGTDGWTATVFNGGSDTPNVTVFAICTSAAGTS
jgi:hypothetical protein